MSTREVTVRQLEVLRAHVRAGTKGAAYCLGLAPSTVSGHLARIRVKLDVVTTEQAVYLLTARGVLVVDLGDAAA